MSHTPALSWYVVSSCNVVVGCDVLPMLHCALVPPQEAGHEKEALQVLADELQQLQAAAQEKAEKLQQQLAATDEQLARAKQMLRDAEGDAAVLRDVRVRAAALDERSRALEQEVSEVLKVVTTSSGIVESVTA